MLSRIAITAAFALLWAGPAIPEQPSRCAPAPNVKPMAGLAPNSTYVSDDEPPKRFRSVPRRTVRVAFGRAAINKYCGRPPCGLEFLGCTTDSGLVVLPDPFAAQDFAKITRHELAHVAGWPASHGD